MAYRIAARFYRDPDQNGESYVLVSDNDDADTKFEVGQIVYIKPRDTAAPIGILRFCACSMPEGDPCSICGKEVLPF